MESPVSSDAERRERWEERFGPVLVIMGIAFLVSYSVTILIPRMPPLLEVIFTLLLVLSWAAFIVDYLVRLLLTHSGHRFEWAYRHVLDLVSTILPVFRALRAVDLIRHTKFFQRRIGSAVRVELAVSAAGYAIIYIYCIALATLHAERGHPDATITSFGNAIWWSFETLTTVGYGDMVPVTVEGRFYAVLLMLGGIIIIGVVSGTVVSYITDRVRKRARGEDPGPQA